MACTRLLARNKSKDSVMQRKWRLFINKIDESFNSAAEHLDCIKAVFTVQTFGNITQYKSYQIQTPINYEHGVNMG